MRLWEIDVQSIQGPRSYPGTHLEAEQNSVESSLELLIRITN